MASKQTGRKTAKALIRELIVKKKSDDLILAEVEKQFPNSNADKKHCTKYRRELLSEGAVDASLAAVGSREHQEWAKANMANAKRGPHGDYWKEQDDKQKEKAQADKEAAKAKVATAKKAPTKAPAKAAEKAPAKKAVKAKDPLLD